MQRFAMLLALSSSAVLATPRAFADVDPASVELTIAPGATRIVETTLTVPEQPPKLDVLLLVDLSSSYTDDANGLNDIDRIKQLAPDIFQGVRDAVPDSQFAVATFSDFPFSAWGEVETDGNEILAADEAYRLELDLTGDRADFLGAVDQLCTPNSARCGSRGDDRESQYEALFQAVTGAGRDVPDLDGAPSDLGDIDAGQQVSFRDDAIKVVVLTSDAPFHEAGDRGLFFPYPGASRDDAVAALQEAGVKVVVIKGIDDGLVRPAVVERNRQMTDIADATGGAVVDSRTDDSADIVATLLEGLENITFTVRAQPRSSCAPLVVEFAPDTYETASAGEPLPFEVSVTVPSPTNASSIDCVIDYVADGVVIDSQQVDVSVQSAPRSCPPRNPPTTKSQRSKKKKKYNRSKRGRDARRARTARRARSARTARRGRR